VPARVGAADVAVAVDTGFVNLTGNPKMDKLNEAIERVMAEKAAARSTLVGAIEVPLPLAVGDDWGASIEADPWDTPLPAQRDARGRILSPVVRDEFIDTP
jgi:hypothetical protein